MGSCLQLSVVDFVKDGVATNLSRDVVLRIPFSLMVIVCEKVLLTWYGPHVLDNSLMYSCEVINS